MSPRKNLHPQFVTDAEGKQTAVILPVAEYEELLDDLEDLACAAERVDEATVSHAQVVRELRGDGYLPD